MPQIIQGGIGAGLGHAQKGGGEEPLFFSGNDLSSGNNLVRLLLGSVKRPYDDDIIAYLRGEAVPA